MWCWTMRGENAISHVSSSIYTLLLLTSNFVGTEKWHQLLNGEIKLMNLEIKLGLKAQHFQEYFLANQGSY
jgi:hypothetical protein